MPHTAIFTTFEDPIQSFSMGVAENLALLRQEIPPSVQIIAVSKTMPVSSIREAYIAGQRDFGENRVQELLDKESQLPADIRWHLIGHLQTNKVRMVLPYIHLIHSVDSLKLLETLQSEASRINRNVDCLLQIRIAREETKFGMTPADAEILLASSVLQQMDRIRIRGLMGMATFSEDTSLVQSEFFLLKGFFDRMKKNWFSGDSNFNTLSMGMSGDYPLAVKAGSNMLRIGSLIFGSRQ